MNSLELTRLLKIQYPVICGAMYPCTNPALVAAVSEAGGLGVVQPLSFVYVYKKDLREGLREIRAHTNKPYGFNALIEASSKIYLERMRRWVDIALEEGCRFFVTALGNPRWVVDAVHAAGGVVFHDVTERKWAMRALDGGVDGLICVNNRAGGHAGGSSPEDLIREMQDLKVPLICAGGVGSSESFNNALRMGYAAVQMGTRFIATNECGAHQDYKDALVRYGADDVVLTERLTGVPVSVLRTEAVARMGTRAGPVERFLLRHRKLKHWMRLYYMLRSTRQLKQASNQGLSYSDFWQAGRSVGEVHSIEPAGDIVRRLGEAWRAEFGHSA